MRIVSGALFGGDMHEAKACQCRVIADVAVAVEEVPEVTTVGGRVIALDHVAPDVAELCIALQRRSNICPASTCKCNSAAIAVRCYSPTVPLDRFGDRHVHPSARAPRAGRPRILRRSAPASQVGHRVKLTGPFGSAYLRPGLNNPMVLVASGTGFAPIWSIADAADA